MIYLQIPRIDGMSQNPKFPSWIPITRYWFGNENEAFAHRMHPKWDQNKPLEVVKFPVTCVADVNGVRIQDLFKYLRTGDLLSDDDDACRLVEKTPDSESWDFIWGAIISFVFMGDGQVTFTLSGTLAVARPVWPQRVQAK